jgi:hypothetical protein
MLSTSPDIQVVGKLTQRTKRWSSLPSGNRRSVRTCICPTWTGCNGDRDYGAFSRPHPRGQRRGASKTPRMPCSRYWRLVPSIYSPSLAVAWRPMNSSVRRIDPQNSDYRWGRRSRDAEGRAWARASLQLDTSSAPVLPRPCIVAIGAVNRWSRGIAHDSRTTADRFSGASLCVQHISDGF